MVNLIAGLDDAGRGSVIGPMVIAGVLLPASEICRLEEIGVRDSKTLSPNRRLILAESIRAIVSRYTVVEVASQEIDEVVLAKRKLHRLNWLEAKVMAQVISELKPDVAYVDASDVIPERFAGQIRELLSIDVKIISEHKADYKWPVVSAASILAKVTRDSSIAKLNKLYGDFGSGYPSDPRTVAFLEGWLKRGELPPFARKSWKTIKRIDASNRQEKLSLP